MTEDSSLPINSTVLMIALVAGALLLILLLARFLRRRPVSSPIESSNQRLHVQDLPARMQPAAGPVVTVYGTPTQLRVVTIAPQGRDGQLPDPESVAILLEQLLAGMAYVIQEHEPEVLCWPAQLSTSGFKQAFFNRIVLPGNRGKGSPWCSVAGQFTAGSQTYLLGLALQATASNPLGQISIEHEGQWLDVLRIVESPPS